MKIIVELLDGDEVVGLAELREDLTIRWDAPKVTQITSIRVNHPMRGNMEELFEGPIVLQPGLEFTMEFGVF